MRYHDQIFGSVNIIDKLVLELINRPVFQRLKGIDQAGHPAYWQHYGLNLTTADYNRFLHSIGVYLLLRKFNAPVAEQIAGLLHDISHTAFSHCADYIFSNSSVEKQDFQDRRHGVFVVQTEIPQILKNYGHEAAYILDEKNFPLKEQPLPDLCADRIEYSLRTAIITNEITRVRAANILERLTAIDNQWIFVDADSAMEFAQLFYRLNNRYYSGPETAVMFHTVSDYIKYALDQSYISVADLDQRDEYVLRKISPYIKKDPVLKKLLDRIENKTRCQIGKTSGIKVICKSRAVDPLCRYNGSTVRLSDVFPSWKNTLSLELQPKVYYLNFEF